MNETNTQKASRSERAQRGLINAGNALGRTLAPLLFLLFVGIVAAYAWNEVEKLFRVSLGQDGLIIGIAVSHFAAAASVGMALLMLVISKYAPHAAVRAGATLWANLYIAITFLLVFIGWALGVVDSDSPELKAVVADAQSVLPFLPLIGSAAVVILASLGLGCFGVLIATSKNDANRFEVENKARAHLVGNLAKVIVGLASVGFAIWFGVTVLQVNAALAALMGIVLDIGLINSWMKAESAAEAGDAAENKRWKWWTYLFGGAVALMAVESVGTQFKTAAATSTAVSPQLASILNSPVFGWLQAVGALAIICAVGLSIVQLLATMRPVATVRMSGDVIEGDATPVKIVKPERAALPTRAAGYIRSQREGWGDLRQALAGDKAAIKQPAQLTAKDAPPVAAETVPDVVMEDAEARAEVLPRKPKSRAK